MTFQNTTTRSASYANFDCEMRLILCALLSQQAPNFARNQVVSNGLTLKDSATPGEHLFNYLLSHERRYGFNVLRMVSSSNVDNEEVTTEYVLAKQWPFKTIQR